jgi:hypothetical protein
MPPLHEDSLLGAAATIQPSPGYPTRAIRQHERACSLSSSNANSLTGHTRPSLSGAAQLGFGERQDEDSRTGSNEGRFDRDEWMDRRQSYSGNMTESAQVLRSEDLGLGWIKSKTRTASVPEDTRNSVHSDGWESLRCKACLIIVPLGGAVWWMTGSIMFVLPGVLSVPLLAIIQGSMAIYRYRTRFGDCPIPKVPAHGIVRVVDKSKTMANFSDSSSRPPTDAPIRLLVIGDSLAIGVGQSSCSTPVMPEAIAKSLSKELDGRPVVWTCYGAPGASAGWIVRELERSIPKRAYQQPLGSPVGHDVEATWSSPSVEDGPSTKTPTEGQINHPHQDPDLATDDASSGEVGEVDHQRQLWQKSPNEKRMQFNLDMVGPFDIAVVLTGSNDLKSAFFPFLLKGEDIKFREQATQQGGGYGKQLTLILQVLSRRMRKQLDTVRGSISGAKQSIQQCLSAVDYGQEHFRRKSDVSNVASTGSNYDSKFPMVVLPGMPSRALPIFSEAPLGWFAVPVIDIMDTHKRKLAKHGNGEVLFVDAPSADQITEYLDNAGEYWEEEQREHVLLRQRDIKDGHAKKIEAEMNDYYSLERNQKVPCPQNRHFDGISIDGIHPNDLGYSFWGRYIASHIVKEWNSR